MVDKGSITAVAVMLFLFTVIAILVILSWIRSSLIVTRIIGSIFGE